MLNLSIVALAVVALQQPAKPPAARGRAFTAPGKNWALVMNLKGYEVTRDETKKDGKSRYVMASSDATGLNVSFWMEPAEKQGDSTVVRTTYWEKEKDNPAAKATNVHMADVNDLAVVYYDADLGSVPIGQRNAHAYLAHDGIWIDIHVSMMTQDKNAADKKIERLLTTVTIGSPSEPGSDPAVLRSFVQANSLYESQQYEKAAEAYQKILNLEKKRRTLDRKYWCVLIDNLGIAYGISGKLVKAKEVFEYGIKKDPTYPLFHYNLACTYAELDQLDNAIASLRTAYENRAHMLPGEKFPDPLQDDSFKRFRGNRKFRAALKQMQIAVP